MKEAWLFQGAVVPVDTETTQALVAEIKRLIDVVGGMALAQRTWVGLTNEETIAIELGLRIPTGYRDAYDLSLHDFAKAIEAKLKERNS